MNKRRVLKYIVWIVLVIACGFWIRGCVRIDTCLDRGGAWDYENGVCDGALI